MFGIQFCVYRGKQDIFISLQARFLRLEKNMPKQLPEIWKKKKNFSKIVLLS